MARKNADGTSKTRVRFTRHGDRFKAWRTTSASAAANAPEVPQAEFTRVALEKVIVEVDQVLIDQSAFRASKQLASQRLKTLVNQGNKLNTVLTTIIKKHYGNGSDKLVEFGIGACQGSCRLVVQAALVWVLTHRWWSATTESRSGLRVTAWIGDQFRVCRDQRAGWRWRASRYKACRASRIARSAPV